MSMPRRNPDNYTECWVLQSCRPNPYEQRIVMQRSQSFTCSFSSARPPLAIQESRLSTAAEAVCKKSHSLHF